MKLKKSMQLILCASLVAAAIPAVSAADDVVYGTMKIPYSAFYAAEGVDSDVDTVSSATTSKWKNENLVAGTYSKENGKGGIIEGVVYPVAIEKSALESLGDDDYGFTELDSVPAAYKEVTVSDGKVSFSETKGASAAIEGVTPTLSSDTRYGDYCIDSAVNNANGKSDVGTIYGVILHTKSGKAYGMRHLENIWRDEIAWSSGFVTKEAHGNELAYKNYTSLVGETIDKITYITDSGYHTLDTELYVPVKFENTLTVENADVKAGKTSVAMTGFPADFKVEYSVDGLDCAVSGGTLTFKDALPGSYTLVVSDASGKYADVKATFTLTTDSMPADVSGDGLVKAAGASDAEFENFLAKISTVTVGETSYAASGKRAVKIIDNGKINAAAAQGETKVFANDGEYDVVVTATGYNKSLELKVTIKDSAVASVKSTGTAEVKPVEPTKTEKPDTAPATADTVGLLIASAILAGAAVVSRKKKD